MTLGGAASGFRRVPQSPQNRAPGALAVPHDGQTAVSRVPHSAQNLRPGSLGALQLGHVTRGMYPETVRLVACRLRPQLRDPGSPGRERRAEWFQNGLVGEGDGERVLVDLP